jgi:uncharacterized membrane protein
VPGTSCLAAVGRFGSEKEGLTVEHVETLATNGALWLKLAVELVGAVVIGIGCVAAMVSLLRTRPGGSATFTSVRLQLSRYLALGLEFQLAADILVTAVAPSWEEIGKLAAIATIRTALNFFLAREMKEERAEEREERTDLTDRAHAADGQRQRSAEGLASR